MGRWTCITFALATVAACGGGRLPPAARVEPRPPLQFAAPDNEPADSGEEQADYDGGPCNEDGTGCPAGWYCQDEPLDTLSCDLPEQVNHFAGAYCVRRPDGWDGLCNIELDGGPGCPPGEECYRDEKRCIPPPSCDCFGTQDVCTNPACHIHWPQSGQGCGPPCHGTCVCDMCPDPDAGVW